MKLIEEIKKNKVILVLVLIIMVAFRYFLYRHDKKKYGGVSLINEKKSVEIDIIKTRLNRTELFLNDSLLIQSGLVIKSKKPSWLKKKSSRDDYENYSFSDIKEPYRLFKQADSKEIFIIKNGDTLLFSLTDLE